MQPINPKVRPQVRPFNVRNENNRLRLWLVAVTVYAIHAQNADLIREYAAAAANEILRLRRIAEHAVAHLITYTARNPEDAEWILEQKAECISFLLDCGFADLAAWLAD